jgi:small-conductance mechanosensitive channel
MMVVFNFRVDFSSDFIFITRIINRIKIASNLVVENMVCNLTELSQNPLSSHGYSIENEIVYFSILKYFFKRVVETSSYVRRMEIQQQQQQQKNTKNV